MAFISFNCSTKSIKCDEFKTGFFKYKGTKEIYWDVTRNDSIQIEYNKKYNLKMTAHVKWFSDCQYVLTYKEVNDSSFIHLIGMKIKIDIINTSKNTYYYYKYINGEKSNGKMTKIE